MPRALIITTENSNLQPIKTLFDKNKVVYGEVDLSKQVTDTDKPLLSEVLKNTDEKYDCVFISCSEWQQLPHDIPYEHCFVVYSSPETYLLSETKKQKTIPHSQYISEWKQYISSCLKLIDKEQSATLISLDDVLTNADVFLKEVFDKAKSSAEVKEIDISMQLLNIGIKASLVDRDDLYELYDELLSHSRLFGSFRVHLSPDVQVFKNEAHSLIEIAKALNEKSDMVAQLKVQLNEMSTNSTNLSREIAEQLQVAESALEEKEALLKEFNKLEQRSKEELTQAELQVFQVQEELEVTFLELESIKNKISNLTDGKGLDTFVNETKKEKLFLEEQISLLEKDLAQQQSEQSEMEVNGVKEELELASLQITQLQEELEYYYLQAVEQSKLKDTEMQKSIIVNSFDSISAEQIKIVGQYEADDYRDLHMILDNASFPHCGIVDTLYVKLINISGKIGVEFRKEGNPDDLFTIYDDCSDEYGPYLRYLPDAPDFLNEQQEKTKQRLNANERLLSFCTLNCIQKMLIGGQFTNDAMVDENTVKDWKLSLADIDFRKYYPIDWLSFDSLTIKECFTMDGYEHLWLQFNNILAGDVLRKNMDIKVCAKNLIESGDEFLASFFLELRLNSDGTEPLYAWPPETSDEYGPKLEIGLQEDLANKTLAKEDERLISLIRDNIQSILVKCAISGATLKHSVNAWCNAIENSLYVNNEDDVTDANVEIGDEGLSPANELLSVEEVIDLDSYQHIVFSSEESQLKVKLRADNINKETFDAEVYLEFRDGTKDVIYNDTEFFDVDDYGPRVKIPAEILEPLSSNADYSGDFEWAAACYGALTPSIEDADKVDDLLKIMWAKLLERKKQN